MLNMTILDGMDFFKKVPKIVKRLKPLHDTGMEYILLGQPSNTLSGGEAQRIKLASFLGKENTTLKKPLDEHILFIFDEPTTGLHFHDIKNLCILLISW